MKLSHLDDKQNPAMVDVSGKAVTHSDRVGPGDRAASPGSPRPAGRG